MARKVRRPKPFGVGSVRVRCIDGPREGGVWRWRAEVHHADGRAHNVWVGWGTREHAEREVARKVAEGDTAKRAEPQPTAPPGVVTMGLVLDRWLGRQLARRDLRAPTTHAYTLNVRHLLDQLRDVLPAMMDQDVLDRYRDARLGEGAAPRTVRAEFEVLRTAWRWARPLGVVPPIDLPRVALVERPVRSRRRPSTSEIARVLAEIRPPWAALAVRLLAGTGARIGEIADLRWRDLDLVDGMLHVAADTKTGARDVPLGSWLVSALRRSRPAEAAPDDRVWPVTRAVIVRHLPVRLRDACDAAGVGRFTPHCLRRAAVDTYARGGVDPASAAANLGHSVETMMKIYREVGRDDQRAAVNRIRLGEIPEGQVLELEEARARKSGA